MAPTPLRSRTLRRAAGRWAVAWALAAFVLPGLAQAPSEPQVKAAYLYQFTQFVTWPVEAFTGGVTGFTVCIAGRETASFEAMQSRSAQGRPIRVRRFGRGDDVRTCQVLFVTEAAESTLGEALRNARNLPVLTVGESEAFAEVSGVIGFVQRDDRVQFAINPDAAARSQLHVSARLLRLAIIVRDGRQVRP